MTSPYFSRPACPYLPPALPALDYRYLRELGPARDSLFYLRALTYGHTLWHAGLTARALLAVTRGLYADVGNDALPLKDWPLPYAALAWLVAHHPDDTFMGNPRVSFQHQAERVKGTRAPQKAARAWAVWHLIRIVRPDLPGDASHAVFPPDRAAVSQRLETFGLAGEQELWQEATLLAGRWAPR